jgi:hypothetical protein
MMYLAQLVYRVLFHTANTCRSTFAQSRRSPNSLIDKTPIIMLNDEYESRCYLLFDHSNLEDAKRVG